MLKRILDFLVPDYVFPDYAAITPDFLRERGILLLLSDLDYTLAPRRQEKPDAELFAWVEQIRGSGVTLEIITNNRSSKRVDLFCKSLGVGYLGGAGKPRTRGLLRAMQKHGVCPEQTAMLGDKLLTDTLAAKRAGLLMLMVEPKGGPVGRWNRVLHVMQKPFKRMSKRKRR